MMRPAKLTVVVIFVYINCISYEFRICCNVVIAII